ncbi:hypothetical protein BaRGS_00009687 [Batillaria attramentaria]|uniref:Uncharacterized protein n=1 Tax=Batillaria attramentaria TaxID=370345 RepID=A0ABD0LIE8_9CAEN
MNICNSPDGIRDRRAPNPRVIWKCHNAVGAQNYRQGTPTVLNVSNTGTGREQFETTSSFLREVKGAVLTILQDKQHTTKPKHPRAVNETNTSNCNVFVASKWRRNDMVLEEMGVG